MEKGNELLCPKTDVVFHALFREENKYLLEGLLTDILNEPIKVKTIDKDRYVELINPEDKYGIMDLRIELENKQQCNIEIQLRKHTKEKERILYYWADTYARQLQRGKEYAELKRTISIVILDHELEELKEMKNLYTKWQIRDNITGKMLLTEDLEICIIEIPKAIREYKKDKQNKIGQWMMFFDNPNKMEVLAIMQENENIQKTEEELKVISGDKELRRIAFLKEKGERDYKDSMRYALETGMAKGMAKGIVKGENRKQIEIVKNMLENKLDIELISKITGLSKEEIEKLKNNID